jgi:serine phosphatase RsbU (regulator of sigma subunit)
MDPIGLPTVFGPYAGSDSRSTSHASELTLHPPTNGAVDKPEIDQQSFQHAELRSECIRVTALLRLFACLFGLGLIRAVVSLLEGRHGEAWPFVVLLGAMTFYEWLWLRAVKRSIHANRGITRSLWALTSAAETLLPTIALFLELHISFEGPTRTLTSPVPLTYFLFIVLSTLHLDVGLSRWTGYCAAAGYSAVSIYVFLRFPEVASSHRLLTYGTSFSYAAFLVLGGLAAGAAANLIRQYVFAALREFESRAKIAALEHDLDIARSIQQGLLPKAPPQIPGFDIAGWNQPADATGGDYFDWQQLADGRLAITVADVTGHGIGPAIGMAVCRAYARAGLSGEPNLGCFIRNLNKLLWEDLPPEKFVTLAAGVLVPAEAKLSFISAGHGPLLFYSSQEDRFCTYSAQGPPLGLFAQVRFSDPVTLEFAPGDALVWVTDGFIEWTNANDEDFGEHRLKDVIRTHHRSSSATIISELYSAVLGFAGPTRQLDDLTVLIMKRI